MPDSSLPPRMLKSPLVLKAMTLRGRGPYLHGARLDIRPLTIPLRRERLGQIHLDRVDARHVVGVVLFIHRWISVVGIGSHARLAIQY